MHLTLDVPDCTVADLTSLLAALQTWTTDHPHVLLLAHLSAPTLQVAEAQALLLESGLAHVQVLPVPTHGAAAS